MIENVYEYDFGGFKYEMRTDCFGEEAFHITSDGKRQELPVHGPYMSAWQAIMIHAMNSNGYSP